jgi:hypothetical protein
LYYRGRSEALTTKIGLSFVTVTVSSSLRDELTDLRPQFVGNDRQSRKNFGKLAEILTKGEFSSITRLTQSSAARIPRRAETQS